MDQITKDDQLLALHYLSGPIMASDINEIKNILKKVNVSLIELDKTGEYTASLDDFTNVISILINTPLLLNIVQGIGTNALWDAIKLVTVSTWKKVLGKKYKKITSRQVEERSITFGIEASFNRIASYNFRFDGLTSEDEMNKALDKILDFLREQKDKEKEEEWTVYLGNFNIEEEKWETRNLLEEIRNKSINKIN
ncbi:hypothetical protein [Brevibacillus brevis]|uniref:hypothetical protein n=1 Tax=Brevibacillus brevis TaxID=1393 RepID=UPI00165DBEE8|nr:hypothetical protein [Brevibacillus brevis]